MCVNVCAWVKARWTGGRGWVIPVYRYPIIFYANFVSAGRIKHPAGFLEKSTQTKLLIKGVLMMMKSEDSQYRAGGYSSNHSKPGMFLMLRSIGDILGGVGMDGEMEVPQHVGEKRTKKWTGVSNYVVYA